ncbi:lipopolysaccharide biosynthesis protein [Sellimonas catena]|uniref:Lipopolysaccharide biosynthesis protein n=1 Tax=Sellimonas catena TaxID=2994035 RepID=A0A9W6FE01_9FIRM|nr:lipopolysaccharide biosynthesis protein [Sellimonas catena]GLG06128.1 lipopolysaccharide biosynthesis protein [Sellimonas catena]
MWKGNGITVISNLLWRFAERSGAQIVTFIVSIILARLLEPEAYGTISLITVFTTILQVFVDSGLGNALIQKKNTDDLDFSSVFYINIGFCLILYALIFICAPFIANFYDDQSLIALIRVLSLTVIISGVKNVQQAYVSKHLMFKKFFYSSLSGTIGAAIIGIILAFYGAGVWALVAQQVLNVLVNTIVLWCTVKWRPQKRFSIQRVKGLFSFGWKLLVSSLIDTVYTNIRQLIIGKMYSSSDLAFYNQGRQFPNVIVSNINTSIDSVLLPVLSTEQDSRETLKIMTRRAITMSTYIMAPLMMGLAFTAPAVVELVLTEKWLPCVPYLRIFCITFMFYPLHTANLNAIKAMGRSDLYLRLEIIKKVIGMILLLSTMWFGVMAMAYSLLVSSVTSQIVNTWPNKALLNYSYLEQLKDIIPSIGLAVFMGICVSFIELLGVNALITLMLQVTLGVIIYIVGSKIMKIEAFDYLWEIIKKFVPKCGYK